MKTMIVILICIALVGAELLGVALLLAPRAVFSAVLSMIRRLGCVYGEARARVRGPVEHPTRARGSGLRPPQPSR